MQFFLGLEAYQEEILFDPSLCWYISVKEWAKKCLSIISDISATFKKAAELFLGRTINEVVKVDIEELHKI